MLLQPFASGILEPGPFRLEERGGRAYIVQDLPDSVRGLHFLRNGLFLGEWKKNRFEPSQPLAMAQNMLFLKEDACRKTDPERNTGSGNAAAAGSTVPVFSAAAEDTRITAYLRGEGIPLTEAEAQSLADGWVLVCADRFSLGWGKKTGRQIKNKYPASWR